ncbi:hypothetical protein ACIF6L_21735 [Kitasatospora sp. NPDC086009]|uniref:hypothetical protein n=1 Tax=unclassified Kitasatospora TaxID=2633591 RepID=UPI0037C61FDE
MLQELILAGGTTVVGAMATDSWAAARDGVARLFRHRGEERQSAIEAQLDSNAALVTRAGNIERARQGLVPLWVLELESLVDEYPEAVTELRVLISEIESARPASQEAWVQTNIARDNGRVFAAMGGNVVVHEAPIELERGHGGEETR